MKKPGAYLLALIVGGLLGWLAQQFWSTNHPEFSDRARKSLMTQNEARLKQLKHDDLSAVAFPSKPDQAVTESAVLSDDLYSVEHVELAAQAFRENWNAFSQDILISRILSEKWLEFGEYESAIALLYEQRLFISFEMEDQLLQYIYQTVEKTEQGLAEIQDYEALVNLYRMLINLHADHTQYYLRLTHWLIESGDLSSAEQSLSGAMNDIDFQQEVDALSARIQNGEAGSEVVTIPMVKVGDHFVVQVLLEGQYTFDLMIDTGATMSVIKTAEAERNLPEALADAALLTMNTANGSVTGKQLLLGSFLLGKHELKNVEVGVVPLPDFDFDGLLGMNVLNRFEFFIDQEQHVLVLK